MSEVLFFDDFDYNDWEEMSSVWSLRQTEYIPTGPRSHVKASEEAIGLSGSKLHLKIIPDPENSGKFLVGHITTGILQNFVYGTIEARVRFGHPKGAHGAVWLQSGYGVGEAELDVVEFFGERLPQDPPKTQKVQHTIHVGIPNSSDTEQFYTNTFTNNVPPNSIGFAGNGMFGDNKTWWKDWHTYKVVWSDQGYDFYVDDTFIETIAPSGNVNTSPSASVPGELILSLIASDGTEYDNLIDYLNDGGNISNYNMHIAWVKVTSYPVMDIRIDYEA